MAKTSRASSLGKHLAALFFAVVAAAAISLNAGSVQTAYADELITDASCTVVDPVASTNPDFVGTSGDTSKYTVTVNQWYLDVGDRPDLSPSDVFDGNKPYRVRIEFKPLDGYYFDDSTIFTINGKSTSTVGGGGKDWTIESDQLISTGTLIENANCTVKTPIPGAHPDFAPVSNDSSKYSVVTLMWYAYEEGYPELTATDTFENGKRYCVRILFDPQPGYYFDDDSKLTINGEATSLVGMNARVQELSGLYASSRPTGFYVVTAGALNVRSGPWQSATRVAGLSYGDVVEVVEVQGIWLGLAPDASTWVNGNYLALTYSPETAINPTEYTITAGALNVRADISTESERIGGLKAGDKILATGERIGADGKVWLVLDYEDVNGSHQLGYIMSDYTDAEKFVFDMPVAHIDFPGIDDDIASHAVDPSFAQPLIAHEGEVAVAGENAFLNADGDVVVTVFPDDGTNFSTLTADEVGLPAGSSLIVKSLALNADGSVAVTLTEAKPSLSVRLSPTSTSPYAFGDTVTFDVSVENDGNIDLTDVVVKSALTGDEWAVASLAPGETAKFSASYVVAYADVEAGKVLPAGSASAANATSKETDVKVENVDATVVAMPATLTFDLAGGALDGKTGTVTVAANVGQTISLPAAPTREGYTFKCWRGSEYAAGAEYVVEGDHPFTAEWVEATKPAVPATGDSNGWLVFGLAIAAFVALCIIVAYAIKGHKIKGRHVR